MKNYSCRKNKFIFHFTEKLADEDNKFQIPIFGLLKTQNLKLISINKIQHQLVLLIFIVLLNSNYCSGAIPFHKTKSEHCIDNMQPTSAQKETLTVLPYSKSFAPRPGKSKYRNHSKDFGLFGILALLTSLLGLFPAAIVLGLIGKQEGRKLQGLAYLGFTIGLVVGILAILVLLFFVFVLAYVF